MMDSLSLDTVTRLDGARAALDIDIAYIRDFVESMSEAWLESKEGSEYRSWVAALERLSHELTDVPDSPEWV